MDVIVMIILTLQITSVISKRSHKKRLRDSSSESIENLLYYQDCKHNKETTTTPAVQILRRPEPPPEPACPCPRMCCSMKCDCNNDQSFAGRQMQQQNPMMPMMQPPSPPHQPPFSVQPQLNQRGKKKKKPMDPQSMMPPIGGRRDLGFTREDIKNLISQDSDIKSILKDLVRVTMKKVDLVEQVQTGKKLDKPLEKSVAEPEVANVEDNTEDEEEF